MIDDKSYQCAAEMVGVHPGKCISWSKNGFIAYAAHNDPSKHNLMLTYLERVDENSWQLAKAQGLTVKPNASDMPLNITMLSWSNLSSDLAVCDESGNFYIYLAGVGVFVPKAAAGSGASTSGTPTANNNGANANSAAPTTGPSPALDSLVNYELTSYNNLELIHRDVVEPSGAKGSKVVALRWLNIEKPQIINKPATAFYPPQQPQQPSSNSVTYNYGVTQYFPQGATHPISTKQACVVLRADGELQLYYQGEHKVEYHKVAKQLGPGFKKLECASIAYNRNRELVVVANNAANEGKIEVYSVSVDWGYLTQSAQKQKADPHHQTPKNQQAPPSLSVLCLYEMSPVAVELDNEDAGNVQVKTEGDAMYIDEHAASSLVSHTAEIAYIEAISPNYNANAQLEVLVAYDTFESLGDFAPSSTTFFRYRLVEQLNLLADAFTELGGVKESDPNEPKPKVLEFQDTMVRNGLIQSIDTHCVDSFVLLYFKDGKIDVLDRNTMKIINNNDPSLKTPPETISTLFDIGYEFPDLTTEVQRNPDFPLMVAVSPNLTSVVYASITPETQPLTFKVFESHRTSISSVDLFVASVGFALCHSYACYTNTCSDDLLALIQVDILKIRQLLKKTIKDGNHNQIKTVLNKLVESIICESHKSILFQLDVFGKELVDKLLSNPPLQKLLSLQLIMGELRQCHKEDGKILHCRANIIVRDIAWIVLNLRSTSFGIMFLLSTIFRQISKKKPSEDTLQTSVTRAECIISLIGSVKWLIDLMIYLNQELLHLLNDQVNNTKSKALNFGNSIALPIILSKIPRLFLMYALSSIGKTNEILKKLHKDLKECNKLYPPMRDALNRYFSIYNNSPLNISQFESFLRECDSFVLSEVEKFLKGKPKTFTLKLEQKMVCQGILSEEMQKIAVSIVGKYDSMVRRDFNVSELYFYEVEWLSIGVSRNRDVCGDLSDSFCEDIQPHNIILSNDERKPITPQLRYGNDEYIDGLRKVVIDKHTIAKSHSSHDRAYKLRKCTRCRSFSYVNDPLVFAAPTTIGLWTMVFQRTCLCGSAWITLNSDN